MRAIQLGMLVVSVQASAAPAFAQALAARQAKRVLIAHAHDPNAPGILRFSRELKVAVREGLPTRVEFTTSTWTWTDLATPAELCGSSATSRPSIRTSGPVGR